MYLFFPLLLEHWCPSPSPSSGTWTIWGWVRGQGWWLKKNHKGAISYLILWFFSPLPPQRLCHIWAPLSVTFHRVPGLEVSLLASLCSVSFGDTSTAISHKLAFVHCHSPHLSSVPALTLDSSQGLWTSLTWQLPPPGHLAHSHQMHGSTFCHLGPKAMPWYAGPFCCPRPSHAPSPPTCSFSPSGPEVLLTAPQTPSPSGPLHLCFHCFYPLPPSTTHILNFFPL